MKKLTAVPLAVASLLALSVAPAVAAPANPDNPTEHVSQTETATNTDKTTEATKDTPKDASKDNAVKNNDTAKSVKPIVKKAPSCKDLKGSRILQLSLNGDAWNAHLNGGSDAKVVKRDKNGVTLSIPVIYTDRNNNGKYDGPNENPVLAPGGSGEGMLYVCNNGPAEGTVTVTVVDAHTGGAVADDNDPFYTDVTVNGRPFKSYVYKDVQLSSEKLGKSSVMEVPLNYEFPFEKTSGNSAGPNALDPTTDKPNTYAAGQRVATFDVRVDIAGNDPRGAVTGSPLFDNVKNNKLSLGLLIASGAVLLGVGAYSLATNKKKGEL